MTRTQRARTITTLERWFVLASAREKLIRPWPTTKAAIARLERFDRTHPDAGLITAAFLRDIFLLAIDREATP